MAHETVRRIRCRIGRRGICLLVASVALVAIAQGRPGADNRSNSAGRSSFSRGGVSGVAPNFGTREVRSGRGNLGARSASGIDSAPRSSATRNAAATKTPASPSADANIDASRAQTPRSAFDSPADQHVSAAQAATNRDATTDGKQPNPRQDDASLGADKHSIDANRNAWQDPDANHLAAVSDRWNHALTSNADRQRLDHWAVNHPERWSQLQTWGNDVRQQWQSNHQEWFNNSYWQQHPARGNWWHYQYAAYRPWRYWWTTPTWGMVTAWTGANWNEGCYYDYGPGGNIVYEDGQFNVNEDPVGAGEEFAQSAAELATVSPPQSPAEAEASEWLALGTFAISNSLVDDDGPRVVQLAINRQGILGGTLFDRDADQSSLIQGKIDKRTQRVAFNSVDDTDAVYETGVYDLLQPQASVLIHLGPDKSQPVLFVRLEEPEAPVAPASP